MYLSRFRINPARREARRLLSSPQAMHAAVMAGFTDPPDHGRGGPRILWRVDQNGHQTILYIVSPVRPDLTHLVEQAGWPTTETWLTRPYGDFLQRLAVDQRWAFRLTANPTRDGRPKDSTAATKRFGHVTVEYQTRWLLDRAKRYGFAVVTGYAGTPNLVLHNRATVGFTRRAGQPPVTLRTATYDGVL